MVLWEAGAPAWRIGPLTIIGPDHVNKGAQPMRCHQSTWERSMRPTWEAALDDRIDFSFGGHFPPGTLVRDVLKSPINMRRIRCFKRPEDLGPLCVSIQILVLRMDHQHNAHARWKRALWKLRFRAALWWAAERGAIARIDEVMREDLDAFRAACPNVIA